MNPFLVPGLEEDPLRPLRPWHEATRVHEYYYADVDHTAESFEEFKKQVKDSSGLLENGRLVVVAGHQGCGKTSLINRCADWLRTMLLSRPDQEPTVVEVMDLTRVSGDDQTVLDRMTQVSRRVADELRLRQRITDPDVLADIMTSRDRPSDLYHRLSGLLHDGLILIMLLPPIKLIPSTDEVLSEIRKYTQLVGGKLVFFMEVTIAESTEHLDRARVSTAPPPILLPVQPLKKGDGHVFGSVRLTLHEDQGEFPKMTEDDMLRIVDDAPRSVKFLQNLLYQVYEERRLANDRYSGQDVVTYHDITDFVYRNVEGWGPSFR